MKIKSRQIVCYCLVVVCQEAAPCGPDGDGQCNNGCSCEDGPQHCPLYDLECSILDPSDCCCYQNNEGPAPDGCQVTTE